MAKGSGLEQYASKWALTLAGSILVLSVAFNNVGIGKVLDAYAQSIIVDMENNKCSVSHDETDNNKRFESLEKDSHPPQKKKGE